MNIFQPLVKDFISVQYCSFESFYVKPPSFVSSMADETDEVVRENVRFEYPVIIPKGVIASTGCILLLHGLNEANWDKYRNWAVYLANMTGKTVILFPIAFHINRAPEWWRNPRENRPLMDKRMAESVNNGALSFANVALSERLSQHPSRFYLSGRQTISDIVCLIRQIRSGNHPWLTSEAAVDFFGYSIGSFLSEIMLMANPFHLFDRSKLFIFCGGSIFKYMHGTSRFIMDKVAYNRIFQFYCEEWLEKTEKLHVIDKQEDALLKAFNAMILPEVHRADRLDFFKKKRFDIAGISLFKDRVMPFDGVEACMGKVLAADCFQQLDFPFDYSHESPFPLRAQVSEVLMNECFQKVFTKASLFLTGGKVNNSFA